MYIALQIVSFFIYSRAKINQCATLLRILHYCPHRRDLVQLVNPFFQRATKREPKRDVALSAVSWERLPITILSNLCYKYCNYKKMYNTLKKYTHILSPSKKIPYYPWVDVCKHYNCHLSDEIFKRNISVEWSFREGFWFFN